MSLSEGTLSDLGATTSYTGVLHSECDVDFIRFFACAASPVPSDKFDVRVNLSSSDPNITVCVYRSRHRRRRQ